MTLQTEPLTQDQKWRLEYIQNLRAVADWFEAHPELPTPIYFNVLISGCSKQQLRLAAKALGHAKKDITEAHFSILGAVGTASLDFYNSRSEICERVKVAEKVIPAHILAAREETIVPEKVEEVFEWRCPGSLLEDAQ